MKTWRCFYLLVALIITAACQQEEQVLPTQIDFDAVATSQQATLSAGFTPTPTATNIPTGPTLPPTYTSTPPPVDTLPSATIPPPATTQGFSADGFIYYIFNQNTIMRLAADASFEQPIETFAGQRISDLTLSPDGTLLAYVGPGNGSAREIYISRLDGSYRQQVSCLGFSEVFRPAWSPDGQRIAFYAAQAPGQIFSIYSAGWVGANTCPQGNEQRQEVVGSSTAPGALAYSPDGTRLFFSINEIFALDFASGTLSEALTTTRGFGPDFNLTFSPADPNLLAYIRQEQRGETTPPTGGLLVINVENTNFAPNPLEEMNASVQSFDWGPQGILASGASSVFTFNFETRQTANVITNTVLPPHAIFSPTGSQVAYIDRVSGLNSSDTPQVFVKTIGPNNNPVQLTTHTDGTISDLVWSDNS